MMKLSIIDFKIKTYYGSQQKVLCLDEDSIHYLSGFEHELNDDDYDENGEVRENVKREVVESIIRFLSDEIGPNDD